MSGPGRKADVRLSEGAQLVLERVSRVAEANAGAAAPTIRTRALRGAPRKVGDNALERLVAEGYLERRRVDAEWRYYSVTPYRSRSSG